MTQYSECWVALTILSLADIILLLFFSLSLTVVTLNQRTRNTYRISRNLVNEKYSSFIQLAVYTLEDVLQMAPREVMDTSLHDDLVIFDVPLDKLLRRLAQRLDALQLVTDSHIQHLLHRLHAQDGFLQFAEACQLD